jgi:hypothetical protein
LASAGVHRAVIHAMVRDTISGMPISALILMRPEAIFESSA